MDEKYIQFIAEEANNKLSENTSRIKNYESKCNDRLFQIEKATYSNALFKTIKSKQQKSSISNEEND